MEPPKGGASAEHQLPVADLQDSGGGAFTKKQPQGASRTSPARQGRRSAVGKWLEGRMLSRREIIGDRRCHQSSPMIDPMIRAVLFATFDYFQKNLEGKGSDAFLGSGTS